MAQAKKQFVRFQARKRGDTWLATVRVSFAWTIDHAARAMAVYMPVVPPRQRFGKLKFLAVLPGSAGGGYSDADLAAANPDTVEIYRQKLIEFDLYPENAAETGLVRQVMGDFDYTFAQVVRVLTRLHPKAPPRRFGHRTVRLALREAAARGITGAKANRLRVDLNSEMADFYRQKLIEFEVFPPEAAAAKRTRRPKGDDAS